MDKLGEIGLERILKELEISLEDLDFEGRVALLEQREEVGKQLNLEDSVEDLKKRIKETTQVTGESLADEDVEKAIKNINQNEHSGNTRCDKNINASALEKQNHLNMMLSVIRVITMLICEGCMEKGESKSEKEKLLNKGK